MKSDWDMAKDFNRQSRIKNGVTTLTVRRPSDLYKAQKEQQAVREEVNTAPIHDRLIDLDEVIFG